MATGPERSLTSIVVFGFMAHAFLRLGAVEFVSRFARPEYGRMVERWESFGISMLFAGGPGLRLVKAMGRPISDVFLFVVTGLPWVLLLLLLSLGRGRRGGRY